MTAYYLPAATPSHIDDGQGFSCNTINYPPGWLARASETERDALGAVAMPDCDAARQRVVADAGAAGGWRVEEIPRAERQAAQAQTARRECTQRIHAMINANAQINLAAAAAAGRLNEADRAAHGHVLDWIDAMRARCREMASDLRRDPQSDTAWPEIAADNRAAATALIARY